MSDDDTKSEIRITPPAEMLLPQNENLLQGPSPHVHDGESISGIMLKVLICLMPVSAASICVFGMQAVFVLVCCTVFSVLFEFLWCWITRRRQTVTDLSAVVTGVILALNLPSAVPWGVCMTGSFIAIIITKELFGGLGQNLFNPAAVARVALLIGFGREMTIWVKPMEKFMNFSYDLVSGATPDVLTGATPLSLAKGASGTGQAFEVFGRLESTESLFDTLIGNVGGSMGETSVIAILFGGIGLLACRLIKWQVPVGMLGTAFVFTGIVHLAAPGLTPGPLIHLFSGGMMFGAFFMATDMVTSPMTGFGSFFYGCLIAVIACSIRIWGSYPEGVSFAIVIMNALVPLIDKLCFRKPFGWDPDCPSAVKMVRGELKK